MADLAITKDTQIADLLAHSPESAHLIIEFRLDCIGCPISRFCTIEDLGIYYHLDQDEFLEKAAALRAKPALILSQVDT